MKLLKRMTNLNVMIYGVKFLDVNFLNQYQVQLKIKCFLLIIPLIMKSSLKINTL